MFINILKELENFLFRFTEFNIERHTLIRYSPKNQIIKIFLKSDYDKDNKVELFHTNYVRVFKIDGLILFSDDLLVKNFEKYCDCVGEILDGVVTIKFFEIEKNTIGHNMSIVYKIIKNNKKKYGHIYIEPEDIHKFDFSFINFKIKPSNINNEE